MDAFAARVCRLPDIVRLLAILEAVEGGEAHGCDGHVVPYHSGVPRLTGTRDVHAQTASAMSF